MHDLHVDHHKQQEEIANTTKVTKKEFAAHDGPFVQGLDNALQSFGVHRQQYFGGTFVGNHIHKALKVRIVIKYRFFFLPTTFSLALKR